MRREIRLDTRFIIEEFTEGVERVIVIDERGVNGLPQDDAEDDAEDRIAEADATVSVLEEALEALEKLRENLPQKIKREAEWLRTCNEHSRRRRLEEERK